MSLPARQRRVLEHIETSLHCSDPKLVALYALFARLTREEEMPRIEELRHRLVKITLRLRLALAGWWVRPAHGMRRLATWLRVRLIPRRPAVLFFPLALAILVTSAVLAARTGSGGGCVPFRQATASKSHSEPRLCQPPAMVTPPIYAR